MRVSLKQIEAFVTVADLGGFRRAAERLHTTQPNISARIASLEGALGLSLMERDAGSVRLTAKGQSLLPRAREVLGSVEGFLDATGDAELMEGAIRLGVTEVVAQVWLADFLRTLKARYPGVVVELTVDFSAILSDALFSRRLDLALQSGPFDREISGRVPLSEYSMTWIAPPAFGLAKGRLSAENLSDHPILTAATGTLIFRQLKAHLVDAGVATNRLAPSTNLAACIQMAVDGLGVACVPSVMAADAIAAGKLERLDYPWVPEALRFEARFDAETSPMIVREAAAIAAEISASHATS